MYQPLPIAGIQQLQAAFADNKGQGYLQAHAEQVNLQRPYALIMSCRTHCTRAALAQPFWQDCYTLKTWHVSVTA